MIRTLIFIILLLASFGLFARSVRRILRALSIGRPERRFDQPGRRLGNVLAVAFGQSKLLREPGAGLTHFFLFWGFIILLSAIIESIIEGIVPAFSLQVLGPLFPPLAVLQEIMGVLVVIAVIAGLARWLVFTPRRYFGPEIAPYVRLDAALILLTILAIMATMFGVFAARVAITGEAPAARFISLQLVPLLPAGEGARLPYEISWWLHIVLVLGFLNYLPYSKHLHILASIPNVYFSSLEPRGALPKLDLEQENAEKFGADDVRELTWKQILDGYSCTDCGRCTAACPANLTGKPLSPRKIMMNIRQRTTELAPVVLAGADDKRRDVLEHRLLDNFVTEEELWDCTTCRACQEECPVMIEHVPTIVDMRRYLVLTEARFPAELTATFKNLETTGSPWAFSPESRADWAAGLDVPLMADAADRVEYLYWVGCAGSYDSRYQKVARAMVQVLRAAGIRFAILGPEEKCNGDPARRSGNEYLAQMLISENIETLQRYRVKKIITTCPHCYNTLKNEYPQFGGRYEVVHHAELIRALVAQGRIRMRAQARRRTTFHDSCYLGRYNGIYRAPREVLAAAGAELAEMKRARDRGLCCGAGGARMFMEETVGKRVNVERTEEALRLRPETIATACPFCMTMLVDGLKAKDADEAVAVRDIAEIVAEALK